MAFTEEADLFFDTSNGFAVSVTIKGTSGILAIFDEPYQEAGEMEGIQYVARIRVADKPSGLVQGDTLVYGARTFEVTGIRQEASATIVELDLEYRETA